VSIERTGWFRATSSGLTLALSYGLCAAADCWPAGPRSVGAGVMFFFCLLGVQRLVAGCLGVAVILVGKHAPGTVPRTPSGW
jgi:hypothetical protein